MSRRSNLFERTHTNDARSRGRGLGQGPGKGAVPLGYAGAEWDYEDGQGYNRFAIRGENPWAKSPEAMTTFDDLGFELPYYGDEVEEWDWAGEAHAPRRPAWHPHEGVFTPLDEFISPIVGFHPDDFVGAYFEPVVDVVRAEPEPEPEPMDPGERKKAVARMKYRAKRDRADRLRREREAVDTELPADYDAGWDGIPSDEEAGYAPGTDQPICRDCGSDIDDVELGYCDPCADRLTRPIPPDPLVADLRLAPPVADAVQDLVDAGWGLPLIAAAAEEVLGA